MSGLTAADWADARALIAAAIAEDLGDGDVTSNSVIPADARYVGQMAARHDMVVTGLDIARAVFAELVPAATFEALAADGEKVTAGTALVHLAGPARGMLSAERTALNLLQHLSGIATTTRAYVDAIAGTGAVLLDTRKTIPGLRRLAKYATRMGGARNHRMGLYDAILIKDNHIAVCGGVAEAVRAAKTAGVPVEVECDTINQAAAAVAAGADWLLLDNMEPDLLTQAVALVAGRAKTEASGGVTLKTIRALAETGVDAISVGRITQSAPAVDIGLDWHTA